MQWIDVKERLLNIKALAYRSKDKEYMIGYLSEDDGIVRCDSDHECLIDVTHWMPLPEPPED